MIESLGACDKFNSFEDYSPHSRERKNHLTFRGWDNWQFSKKKFICRRWVGILLFCIGIKWDRASRDKKKKLTTFLFSHKILSLECFAPPSQKFNCIRISALRDIIKIRKKSFILKLSKEFILLNNNDGKILTNW